MDDLVICKKCGQEKPASRSTPGWCLDCERAYNNRYMHMRMHQDNWMEVAKDSNLELWERQPGETQLEWSIWQAYRDSYPGKKPTYKDVTRVVDTTVDFVKKVAQRWNYSIRMQAWMTECDKMTLAQRRQEVLDMNADHIDMAKRLRDKLSKAIDLIDPAYLKPSDLNSLMKTVSELENKAHLNTMAVEQQRAEALVEIDNPELKKSPTKSNDLGEVVSILLAAGALGDITQIGVRKTETTEVVVKE